MSISDFEAKLLQKYGKRTIPREEVKRILEEAVRQNIIEQDEIGPYGDCTVPGLMQLMREWRTDFLKDSFSINDMYSYKDDTEAREHPDARRKAPGSGAKDSFVTTDETFLSSLRDKTRIITERGTASNRDAVRGVLKALSEYERMETRKRSMAWLCFIPLLLLPMFWLYERKPF
jgi:hypothetical protein